MRALLLVFLFLSCWASFTLSSEPNKNLANSPDDFQAFILDFFDWADEQDQSGTTTSAANTPSSFTPSIHPFESNLSTYFCSDVEMGAIILRDAIDKFDLRQIYRIIVICRFPVDKQIHHHLPMIPYAAANGNLNVLAYMIHFLKSMNVDINTPFLVRNLLCSPLAYAATLEIFDLLVREGADINFNFVDFAKEGSTFKLVHYAVVNKCVDLLERLIELGADVSEPASNGRTPLQIVQILENQSFSETDLAPISRMKEILIKNLKK